MRLTLAILALAACAEERHQPTQAEQHAGHQQAADEAAASHAEAAKVFDQAK